MWWRKFRGGNSSSSGTVTPTTPVITTQTLSLIDDKVSGVKYVNGTASGFTDANGNFPYTSGTVEFYLGDIKLGSLSSISSDKNVFIQDILGIDRTDTSNAKVLKIASLLQSLDSNTSTDEIEIKEDDFNKFKNLNVTSIDENSDIQTLLSNLNFTKVSDETAKRHLDNSLKYYSVVSDTTAPTLLTSSITNGAINVSKDANIVLSFSDDIRRNLVNSTNIVLIDSNSNVIECDITSNFKTITVKPKSNLSYATSYNLTIKKELEDYGKNSLGTTDITISFTTQSQPDTNAPTITSASTFSVNENQTSAFTVIASDDSNTAINYSIEGTDSSLFNINSSTGAVTFKSNPDFETKASYSLIVKATDTSNNSSTQNVSVVIINVDETVPDTTPPVITSASTYSVAENQTSAFQVVATDDSNTTITYSIVNQNDANAFSINPTSGVVTFNSNPDYETKTSYSLTVKATDSSNNTASQNVTVNISDVIEIVPDVTYPTITSASTFSVNENQTNAFSIIATDNSTTPLTYSLSGTDATLFDINPTTGVITFKSAPDYETKASYYLTIKATDASNNTSSKIVTINISDIDEIAPTITSNTTFTVNENQTSAFTATATDTSGISNYALSGTDANSFNIDSTSGVVTFKSNTDYETKSSYSIILTATDTLNNSSSQNVTINIVNLDETTPTFTSSSTVSVNENQTSVITAMATDDSSVTYSIEGTDVSYFNIVSNTGVITFKTNPDYETKSSYSIIVKATDTSNNFSTQNLTVNLNDVDEVAPNITSLSSYSVPENQTSAFTVSATDTSSISYSISGGTDANAFSINPTSGAVTFNTAPDYESGKISYSVTVKATDSSTNFSTKDVTVSITDVNENLITFNSLQYEIITSPITGKRWLDRNLGASRACTASDDALCYGDYYQWGRLADGHEKSNSTTTSTLSTGITSVGNQFITGNSDWTTADADGSQRSAQWSKTDGTGVCPVGFRVPNQTELASETTGYTGSDNTTTGAVKVINSATAFSNFLKFPVAGYRDYFGGSMGGQGLWGDVWTSSVDGSDSVYMGFGSGGAGWDSYYRANGLSVRCVEN